MSNPTTNEALDRPARLVQLLDYGVGSVLVVVTAVLTVMVYTTPVGPDRPDAGGYLWVLALWLGPTGLLFLVAGTAFRRRWPVKWFFQVLPVAFFVGVVAFFALAFL